MKRFLAVMVCLVMLACMMVGCSSGGDTIKIGVIAPLTGEVAVYGTATDNGIELYVEQLNANGGINGKQVELVTYDDKGDATEALNAYNKLVSADEVCAIIGPVTSGPTFGVAEASAADGIPCITATATHPDVTTYGDNFFRSCFEDPFQGGAITSFAYNNLEARTAAIIYNTSDSYSEGLKDSITAKANELGLEIVATEGYSKGDVDFRAQLTNIKSKNPDVLFTPDYYNNVYMICKQAREMGIESTFLGVDGTDGVLEIEGADTSVFDGMYLANHYSTADDSPAVQDFIKAYQEKYDGATPVSFSALGYDAAKIMCNAIGKALDDGVELGANADSYAAIISELKKTDLDCVTGHITFDENNNPVKECVIIGVQDGAYTFVTKA